MWGIRRFARKRILPRAPSAASPISSTNISHSLRGRKAPDDIYDGGNKYPTRAIVRLESFDVPVNAKVVHVPVTLDKPSPNTVIAHVRVSNGQGGRANPATSQSIIFRPGDPLTKTATFNVSSMSEGNDVKAVQSEEPDGGERQDGGIRITAKTGAVNEPMEGGRLLSRSNLWGSSAIP